MKNKKNFFSTKTFKSYILTSILILIASNCFSQWKTAEANNIKDDIIISYEVIYDKELSLEEKKSAEYISQIVVSFDKDNLIERWFSKDLKAEKIWHLSYNTLKTYACSGSGNNKNSFQYDFKEPSVIVEPILNIEPKIIFEFPCEKAKVMIDNIPKDIYYTKKIGLKYCKDFKIDGFLMEYPGYSKTLGYYTVKAKRVTYYDLPKSFYSLNNFDRQGQEVFRSSLLNTYGTADEKHTKYIGKKAFTFKGLSIKNEKLDTEKMLGDVIVYNFWIASEPYDNEILKLNQLKKKYNGKNVHFVAIALNPEFELNPFLKKYPFDYDIIPEGNSIANKFDAIYPTNIIVDKKGIIQFYDVGYKADVVERMSSVIDKYLE